MVDPGLVGDTASRARRASSTLGGDGRQRGRAVEPGRREALDRRLVAGRRRDLRAGPEVVEVDGLDRVGIGHQQARRPEPVGQVEAARLELGGEPAVEDDDRRVPDRRCMARRRGQESWLRALIIRACHAQREPTRPAGARRRRARSLPPRPRPGSCGIATAVTSAADRRSDASSRRRACVRRRMPPRRRPRRPPGAAIVRATWNGESLTFYSLLHLILIYWLRRRATVASTLVDRSAPRPVHLDASYSKISSVDRSSSPSRREQAVARWANPSDDASRGPSRHRDPRSADVKLAWPSGPDDLGCGPCRRTRDIRLSNVASGSLLAADIAGHMYVSTFGMDRSPSTGQALARLQSILEFLQLRRTFDGGSPVLTGLSSSGRGSPAPA